MEHAVDEFEISPNSTVGQQLITNYYLHIYLLHKFSKMNAISILGLEICFYFYPFFIIIFKLFVIVERSYCFFFKLYISSTD